MRIVTSGSGWWCAATAAGRQTSGSGNWNVGFTVYDSMDVSVQNMLVVDRVLAGNDSPYADFACARHTPPLTYFRTQTSGSASSLNSRIVGSTASRCGPDARSNLEDIQCRGLERRRRRSIWRDPARTTGRTFLAHGSRERRHSRRAGTRKPPAVRCAT